MIDKNSIFQVVSDVVTKMGGKVIHQSDNYLATTFTSNVFQFVDDVEFRFDGGDHKLYIRSASRVGYGDMNANRNRATEFRQLLADRLNQLK
jgi:uncharacterized protein (DUF1499 family)